MAQPLTDGQGMAASSSTAPAASLRRSHYLFYDLETTGRSWKSALPVQIAAAFMSHDFSVHADKFVRFVRIPGNRKVGRSEQINRITDEKLRLEGKTPDKVLTDLEHYVHGRIEYAGGNKDQDQVRFGAHNGHAFDMRFLLAWYNRVKRPWPHLWSVSVDSLRCARMASRETGLRMRIFSDLNCGGGLANQVASVQGVRALDFNQSTLPNEQLGTLHTFFFGEPIVNAHDAVADVDALVPIFVQTDLLRLCIGRFSKNSLKSVQRIAREMHKAKDFSFHEETSPIDSDDDSLLDVELLADAAAESMLTDSAASSSSGAATSLWRIENAQEFVGAKTANPLANFNERAGLPAQRFMSTFPLVAAGMSAQPNLRRMSRFRPVRSSTARRRSSRSQEETEADMRARFPREVDVFLYYFDSSLRMLVEQTNVFAEQDAAAHAKATAGAEAEDDEEDSEPLLAPPSESDEEEDDAVQCEMTRIENDDTLGRPEHTQR
jgi:hypothetical protein